MRLESSKIVFRRGSAADPAGGTYDAPPDPLVGWGGGYPLPIHHPSTPSAQLHNCTTFKFYSLFINVFTIITNCPKYFQLTLQKIPCSILIILAPKVFILTSFVVPLDRDVLSTRKVYYGTYCLMN